MKMDVKIETITPEKAKKILGQNTKNRNTRKHHIAKIARDMAKGHWQFNGDAIRLAKNGLVLDGQHRLLACVKSETPFDTLVIRNLDPEIMKTIDSGTPRSHGDRLKINGVSFSSTISGGARMLAFYARGSFDAALSHSDLHDIVEANPAIHEAAAQCHSAFHGLGSCLTAIMTIAHRLDMEELGGAYVEVFRKGIPAYEGDPAHTVREKILRAKGSAYQILMIDQRKLLAAAWNKFAMGQPAQKIRIPEKATIKGWTPDMVGCY